MPVRTFVDSGEIAETGKQSVAAFQTYAGFRQKGRHLANPDDTTEHYVRVVAREDGSFTVMNSRNGRMREYVPRNR